MRPTPAQLQAALLGILDDAGTIDNSNAGSPGRWKEFAEATEALAGASTSANDNVAGYMLRSALALESLSGTDGTAESYHYHGIMTRIVDALEALGAVGTGSLAGRLVLSAEAAVFEFDPVNLFGASDEGGLWDVSDLSTVWQNTAGTTPAVANDPVARVDDKSGNGNHLLIADDTKRPLLREAAGLYYLQFDKVDDTMAALFAIPQPWERISGIYMGDWTAGRRIFDGGSTVAGTLFQTGTTPAIALYDGAAVAASNTGLTVATNKVVTERHNGASSRLAVDNGAYTTGDPGTTDPGGITLAAEAGGTTEFGFLRFFGAVMVGRALTDTEIANTRTWMGGKVGLVL